MIRASDFLGFGRCFIALEEDGHFQVRYGVEKGEPRRVDTPFPEGMATRALRAKEVFWTDEASRTPGANLDFVTKYKVHQFLAVPLLGTSGRVLGMFGVLDRLDGTGISPEDIRRARALSNQAAVVLEVARNLHLSEQHRRRAEALIELAREMDGALRLPEFARRFVSRTAELISANAGLLAVMQEGRWQVAALHAAGQPGPKTSAALAPPVDRSITPQPPEEDRRVTAAETSFPKRRSDFLLDQNLERALHTALSDFVAQHAETVVSNTAEQVIRFGSGVPIAAGPIAPWCGSSAPTASCPGCYAFPAGLLLWTRRIGYFSETMAGHAAMALENARLFTRIEQANRHWMEIFDAITDFIVVHDQSDKVLRVNRSLAAMIGVPPAELIGVNMRALLALTNETASYSCPFCRAMADDSDEFVHPVFDRTYLVSTSRVHGASDEGLQTIHVLKDISDRREAERRYRELFDNIQEGLFFSTPSGRFIEVNDAMVRMLGYSSREELLQIDIPTELYFSPEQREATLRSDDREWQPAQLRSDAAPQRWFSDSRSDQRLRPARQPWAS